MAATRQQQEAAERKYYEVVREGARALDAALARHNIFLPDGDRRDIVESVLKATDTARAAQ